MECGGKRSATPLWVGIHAGRQILAGSYAEIKFSRLVTTT